MKILTKCKDGGTDSNVDAFVLFEIKSLCSVMLLRFNKGSREAFHSHAFDAYTWFLKGLLLEEKISGPIIPYERSWKPKLTPKTNVHRVLAMKTSWCFTIRGKWEPEWFEVSIDKRIKTVFTHGRKILRRVAWKGAK